MEVTLLTGSDELNFSLDRYLRYLFQEEIEEIFMAKLGHPETLEQEMLSSDLWIIEALNPEEYQNPEGFRTAKKFAEKSHILLLFLGYVPENFPKEGKFWLVLPSSISIVGKLKNILAHPLPSIKDFLALEKRWSLLKIEPLHHHHP